MRERRAAAKVVMVVVAAAAAAAAAAVVVVVMVVVMVWDLIIVLQPQLDVLRPHLPEFDGLVVRGEGLEKKIAAELQQVSSPV